MYLKIQLGVENFSVFQFCCAPRKQIKAFVTPKDMAEIHQAAKRLNVSSTVQSMVANADPKKVESTFEELKTVDEHLVDIQDGCQCIEGSQCPDDRVEYTFGKSCEYGLVRCCLSKKASSPTTTSTTTTTASTTTRTPTTTSAPLSPSPTRRIRYQAPAVLRLQPSVLKLNPQELANHIAKKINKPTYKDLNEDVSNLAKVNSGNHQSFQIIDNRNDFTHQDLPQESVQGQAMSPEMKRYLDDFQRAKIAQEREFWRRRLQPTLWEKVVDILDFRTWFQ